MIESGWSLEDWRNLSLAVASTVGTFLAILTYATWRRSFLFEKSNDLGSNLLFRLIMYKEAIQELRKPGLLSWEFDRAIYEEWRNHEDIAFKIQEKALLLRLEKVEKTRSALFRQCVKAEAFWGAGPLEKLYRVYDLEKLLRAAISELLEDLKPSRSKSISIHLRSDVQELKACAYIPNKGDDLFAKKLDAVCTPLMELAVQKSKK